jgi:hypothetical protein
MATPHPMSKMAFLKNGLCYNQEFLLHMMSFIFVWRNGPTRAKAASFFRFLHHTQWHVTVGRTPLHERSARRRDLYLTTHNTHMRQTSMPPERFEPAIPASDRPQTLALDRSATGIGYIKSIINKILNVMWILIYYSFCIPNFATLSHNIQIRSSLLYKMRLAETCRQKSELLGLPH